MKTIDDDVLDVLNGMRCEGQLAYMTCGQLDRDVYSRVDKVLQALGGKWSRKHGGHVFDRYAAQAIAEAIGSGECTNKKQAEGFFETPQGLAESIVAEACIEPGYAVLEPSAGLGALAVPAREAGGELFCVESDGTRCERLLSQGFWVHRRDFLGLAPRPIFDRVVMNPPFATGAAQSDIDHVTHAFKFLKANGLLVAIMSSGWTFRNNSKSTQFAEFVREYGSWITNSDDAFRESGTRVKTVTVRIRN